MRISLVYNYMCYQIKHIKMLQYVSHTFLYTSWQIFWCDDHFHFPFGSSAIWSIHPPIMTDFAQFL